MLIISPFAEEVEEVEDVDDDRDNGVDVLEAAEGDAMIDWWWAECKVVTDNGLMLSSW